MDLMGESQSLNARKYFLFILRLLLFDSSSNQIAAFQLVRYSSKLICIRSYLSESPGMFAISKTNLKVTITCLKKKISSLLHCLADFGSYFHLRYSLGLGMGTSW